MRGCERGWRDHRAEAVGRGHVRHAPAAHREHRAAAVRVRRGQRAEWRVRQDDLRELLWLGIRVGLRSMWQTLPGLLYF